MIAIIDYQMGNLRSVEKAFLKVGGRAIVTSDKNKISKADKIVLPGVGAFGDGMKELKKLGLVDVIKKSIAAGKPFFGICLGMQLLFEESEEAPGVEGLGVLDGKVKKFRFQREKGARHQKRCQAPFSYKVPHMGWNQIEVKSEKHAPSEVEGAKDKILENIPDQSYFYFVHSYYCDPKDKSIIAAKTDYGIDFASVVCKDNVSGCQFHPEKSQDIGFEILRSFVRC